MPVGGTVTVDTSALATAAKQDTTNTDLGPPGATVCATDTGSCSINALVQRLAQRLTSAIAALGSPFQAGGALGAGETHIGQVGSNADILGCNFTRPNDTTAYASGDLVANSTTAGSVAPCTIAVARANDKTVMIGRARLKKSGTSTTNAAFRVHLYKNSPTVTNGDNGAWLSTESVYIGCFDITVDKAFSDAAKGVGAPCAGNFILAEPSSGTQNIFALIEARGAYTPAAQEVFTIALEAVQN